MKVVTAAQMKRLEQQCYEETGLPGVILMENAALALKEQCLAFLGGKGRDGSLISGSGNFDLKRARVIVVAGTGGNGGDGIALARHLHLSGPDTQILLVGDAGGMRGDAKFNLDIARRLGIKIDTMPVGDGLIDIPYALEGADLVVDALFGIGLDRCVEGSFEYVIDMMNTYGKYIISADIPSGVNADTGHVMGKAVMANKTVTFGYPKPGMLLYPGAAFAGEIITADICLPYSPDADSESRITIYADDEIPALLPKRSARSNKGTYGRILGFAGSAGMPGAAVLSAEAAYRAGAGYVCAAVTSHVGGIIQSCLKEVVTLVVPDRGGMFFRRSIDMAADEMERANVIYIGPGLGRAQHVTEFVEAVITAARAPLVIDADALNALSENINIFKNIQVPCIITPHPGEMSRLTGLPTGDIMDNTIQIAQEFAREFDVVVCLKDARSVCANADGDVYINITGDTTLAKAGSGDILTGVIAGLLAQGCEPFVAASLGMYLHGKAGETAGRELSKRGALASDVLRHIPSVLGSYEALAVQTR
jgi:NAD(P)H-hydrate epimerase